MLNGAQGDDRVAIDNKLKVANDFTQIVDGRPLTDPEFGFDGLAVTYKGDADAAAAREFLKGVTSDPSTVPTQDGVKEVVAEKIADPTDAPVETGKTFTLTTAADNFTGTSGNDIFNGLIDGTTAALSTLSAADKIAGGQGVDTLFVTTTNGAVANVLNGADISGIEVVSVRNTNAAGTAATVVNAAGLTAVNAVRGSGDVTVTAGLAQGASFGIDGTTGGAMNMTYANAATSAALNVTNGATAGAVTINGAGLTSATITSISGANTLGGVALAATTTAVTVDAQSNITTGNITGLAAGSSITVKGAGTANIGTLLATNVTKVDASANTGGVTATLNNVATLNVVGGSGNDVLTTDAVLVAGASVDAGAGTADRLVVAESTHLTAATAQYYKGFEQVQAADGTSVDVSLLAANNAINIVRIADGDDTDGTAVTNLTAAQAANVQIISANGTGAITIGVKDASVAGQIDTVKAALTTTTTAGVANNIDLTDLTLAGVEKLELTGNGTAAATTGAVTLTTSNATALDSIIIKNAGTNNIVIDAGQTATNLLVDASGSTGNTTIDASAYNTTTGAQLLGGSGHDVLLAVTARSDKLVGGAGNDVIAGTAIGDFTAGTATALGTVTGSIDQATASDILTGGEGRDVFAIGRVDAIANISSITDLNLGGNAAATGVDAIYFDLATTSGATPVTVVALSDAQKATVSGAADLAAAVEAALQVASGVNNVVQFTYGTDTYLAVNGADAGFAVDHDALVKITGVSGTLDASDIVII